MRKFVVLFLVFSIISLSVNLMAKERRGADLLVQKKDGRQVSGELITVKENSLLLKESESGSDVTIDIGDINIITIVKKPKVGKGIGFGFLIGGSVGALGTYLLAAKYEEDDMRGLVVLVIGAIGAGIGALLGGILGAVAGIDETFEIEEKSEMEIKEVLKELSKKARVPDFQ